MTVVDLLLYYIDLFITFIIRPISRLRLIRRKYRDVHGQKNRPG